MDFDSTTEPRHLGCFVTTRWSLVLSACEGDQPQSKAALEMLCQTYWPPLYAYVRRQGNSPHDCQHLTLEFFAQLLKKNQLQNVEQEKGKFRTFLLVMLKRFLADEWDKNRAQKRGNGQVFPVDFSSAEAQFLQEPSEHLNPEKLYERRWALKVLSEVYAQLENEYREGNKQKAFSTLRFALTSRRADVPYSEFARTLGTTEGAIKVAVHRLRQRYRELLRKTIADTVSTAGEVEEELQHLLQALST